MRTIGDERRHWIGVCDDAAREVIRAVESVTGAEPYSMEERHRGVAASLAEDLDLTPMHAWDWEEEHRSSGQGAKLMSEIVFAVIVPCQHVGSATLTPGSNDGPPHSGWIATVRLIPGKMGPGFCGRDHYRTEVTVKTATVWRSDGYLRAV